MRRLRRILCLGPLSILVGCARCDAPPPRPRQPTLRVAPDPGAPASGRRVVAVGQIAQTWHVGAWAPAAITLAEVAPGDAIVVLAACWGDLPAGSSTEPADDQGALRRVLDQGAGTVGRKKPPVFVQLYVELDPAPGPHTIIPPYLGGPAGDGTLYVAQVRGLTERRVVASGDSWVRGSRLPEIAVATDRPAEAGDLVIALAGYDNVDQRDHSGFSHPPVGWIPLGLNDDAANNVPSELCYRAAPAPGGQALTWTWTDPSVNVAAAVIAALR
ncbi:MAG: hypothetical protein E6J90_16665 [Deltaproteobacteria bacterium]|nr:MAG: hypothetical protein E6J90_16665 [Deltaproteobacteria bacterium]